LKCQNLDLELRKNPQNLLLPYNSIFFSNLI
jgi:hypothetical protein